MKAIKKKDLRIKLPQSWNELTDSQMRRMAKLFYSGVEGKKFDYTVFRILYNCRWWQLRKKSKFYTVLSGVPLSELKKHYAFIYNENNRTIFPQSLTAKKESYFSPFDKLTNLTAEEFAIADDMHIKFRESQNPEYLHYLMAVLYTRSRQPRPVFDKNDLSDKSLFFKEVDLGIMLAAELAYFGCKNGIQKRYPQAFPKRQNKKPGKRYGFSKVILQMAGGKFGNHKETRATNIYTFLEEFNENLKADIK